jgi:hypothetical protein
MNRSRQRGVVSLFLVALASCSPVSTGPSDEVHGVQQSEIHLLPTNARFVAVQSLVLAEEALWVLDDAPPFLTRVSLDDGQAIRAGEEGQGPGELLDPWAIQPGGKANPRGIQVWDLGNNRVSTFDSLGCAIGSERLSDEGRIRARADIRSVSYADPFRIRNAGTGVVLGSFPKRVDGTSDLGFGSLRRADSQLNPGPEFLRFADHMSQGTASLKEWAAVPLWDVCDEVVALWSPASAEVAWVGLQGEVRGSVGVDLDPTPLSLRDIEAYLRWMARLELGPDFDKAPIEYGALARSSRDRFAEFRPGATDLRCESEAAAWLRLFDTSSDPLGRSHTWLRVSPEGERRRFSFPEEFTPTVFTPQGAYGMMEAPEGYQRLAWWERESPHEGPLLEPPS